jgi:hypothetical protein
MMTVMMMMTVMFIITVYGHGERHVVSVVATAIVRVLAIDFFPSYGVAIFKRTRPTGSHRPLCLFSSVEQRVRHYSGLMKDCHIAFLFCESKQLHLPF